MYYIFNLCGLGIITYLVGVGYILLNIQLYEYVLC